MQLLDHVSIGVPDIGAARRFYDAVMAALGAGKVYDEPTALGYGERGNAGDLVSTYLSIYLDPAELGPSRRHWCFKAGSRARVDAFFEAGLTAGGQADGAPGLRAHYHRDYYAAFLVDPAGNRIEAVCHAAPVARSSAAEAAARGVVPGADQDGDRPTDGRRGR